MFERNIIQILLNLNSLNLFNFKNKVFIEPFLGMIQGCAYNELGRSGSLLRLWKITNSRSGFVVSFRITSDDLGATLSFRTDPIKSAHILILANFYLTTHKYSGSGTLRERRGGFLARGLVREGCLEYWIIGDIFDDLMLILIRKLVLLLWCCCRRRCIGCRRRLWIHDTLYLVL